MDAITESFKAAVAVEKYDVVYVNTPWHKLSLDELASLPLADICRDNATLYMWADSSTVCDAANLIAKWDFKFQTVASILNLADKPAPTAAPVVATKEEAAPEETSAPADADAPKEESAPAPTKRGPRIKTIQPPSWWGSVPSISRPTTEQLWVAVRGEGAPMNSKFKTQSYQIMDMPELAKSKARGRQTSPFCPPEWSFRRPTEFLAMVSASVAPGSRVIELFGDSLHESVHSLGPAIPTQYVPALASEEGSVGVAKEAMADQGKVALRSLAAKLRKQLAPPSASKSAEPSIEDATAATAEDATVVSEPSAAMETEEQDGSVTAVLQKCSEAASGDWASIDLQRILSAVADYKLAHHHSRSRKVKRASRGNFNQDGSERKRYGIAAATPVAPELCEFLGLPPGTPVARTSVGKSINKYVAENNLKQGRIINLDDKLKALLKPAPDQVVSYFSICKLLNPLFPKKVKAVEAPEDAPDAKKQKVEAA